MVETRPRCGTTGQQQEHITRMYVIHIHLINDQICKKGSYAYAHHLEHIFHHHSIDISSENSYVHVLWPTVHQSAFPGAAF